MPSYRAETFIGTTLEALMGQTFAEWECIIVDDGSPDRTADVADEYAKRDNRFRVMRQKNAGASVARNNGFAATAADSTYVVFHDCDDVWYPNALEKLVSAIEADPAATAVHGLAEWMENDVIRDPGSLPYFQRERFAVRNGRVELMSRAEPTVFESVVFDCRTFPLCCVLMRRTALERAGELFDAKFRISQDWDLFFRVSAIGHFAMVDEPICLYRRHGHNLSGNRKAMEAEFVHIRRKAYRSTLLSASQKQTVRDAHRLFQKHKANMWLGTAYGAIKRGRLAEAGKWICYWAVNVNRYFAICLNDPISRPSRRTWRRWPVWWLGRGRRQAELMAPSGDH